MELIKNTNEFPADYTLLDIETTGLSYYNNEIIELSAIKVRDDKIINEFSMLVKPDGSISAFITHLTGISEDMVKNAPHIKDVLHKFLEFLSDDIIIGHNVKFDINFIQANLSKYLNIELKNEHVDTMRLARRYCKLPSHKLKSLAKHYNVNIEGHHRALNDCIITYEIYKHIKNEFCTD